MFGNRKDNTFQLPAICLKPAVIDFSPPCLLLMNWTLGVDSLTAFSLGIITSMADGQHDPLF